MPVCDAANTIDESLDSLINQTLHNIEIVIVDDGSNDATVNKLKIWQKKDARIKIIRQPHRGIIAALNNGLKHCRAPLVARMDADDRCHPARLEKQTAFLASHPQHAVVGCLVSGFPIQEVHRGFQTYLDWLNRLTTDEKIRRERFVESPLPHPSVVFRKAWVTRAGGYQDHGWAEDYDLWLRLALMHARFAKVPEFLYEWREHPDRLTHTDSRYAAGNFLQCKVHYLRLGETARRDAIIIWGAGTTGKRLNRALARHGIRTAAFIDVDRKKIGRTIDGIPVLERTAIDEIRQRYHNPLLLAAVGIASARQLIRQYLQQIGLQEGTDWLAVA